MTFLHRSLLSTGMVFCIGVVVLAADWDRFRGPNGSGIAEGPMPSIDPAQPLWKVTLPGKGNGSPIVVAGRIYLQSASSDGGQRWLICLDAAEGKTLWTRSVPGSAAKTHVKNSLASSTPASDGQRLYCVWWDGSTVAIHAYDLDGKELWRTPLGSFVSQHGPGFSPIVHKGIVYVNVDDDEHAELVALDAATGARLWKAPRKKERACYSTPFLLQRPGKPEAIVVGTTHQITAYEPKQGKILWNYTLTWPKGQMPLRVIGHPVYVADRLIMACGDGSGARYMIALDLTTDPPRKAWELQRGSLPYVPCMLTRDNLLFWIGDYRGSYATCADPTTGKILFSEQIMIKETSASPILMGDRILAIADTGEYVIFKAQREFEEIAKGQLGQKVIATPAAANGRLYIRGETHLFCFGPR
ncbi:MAG: PQQ-like beta-propeller repeat protein [Gemmataceae bacterium]|nr:PQQ-like beta-propeller repeat protein [Gemmataceae bacterium]